MGPNENYIVPWSLPYKDSQQTKHHAKPTNKWSSDSPLKSSNLRVPSTNSIKKTLDTQIRKTDPKRKQITCLG
jgi:hypothetical protein